jgi:hypothetical protein
MNFVADAGISPRTVKFLLEQGHDVVHVRDIGMQRANDTEILELARSQDRIVLTFDLDFGDLLALGLKDKPSTNCETGRYSRARTSLPNTALTHPFNITNLFRRFVV